jgi:glucose/arabinose dehydrogenase
MPYLISLADVMPLAYYCSMKLKFPHLARAFTVALLFLSALGFSQSLLAQTLPANFTDSLVADVGAPTAIAFTPDGRMLVTSQGGQLRLLKGSPLTNTQAIDISSVMCGGGEQGLLGVAVDPLFTTNKYIYLFYTAKNNSSCGTPNYGTTTYSAVNQKVNRVSRFVLADDDTVALSSELILVDRMPARGTNHNAGDLHFGKDGYLYISIGDGGTDWTGSGSGGGNDAARDKNVLTGKILRVTRDGGIPPDNPFTGAGTARCNINGTHPGSDHCQETYAWGLRNPFRFAMDPNAAGTRFFINDVGQGAREEINLNQSGADYGWNCREGSVGNSTTGKCSPTPPNMVGPYFDYGRTAISGGLAVGGCASITGGAVVPTGVWPAPWAGRYLFADYVCGGMFAIDATTAPGAGSSTVQAANFVTNLGGSSATSLRFGPDAAGTSLYYTTYASGGEVRKIRYDASANSPPTVTNLTANPTTGIAPLNVSLSVTANDPNAGDTLSYFWDFGDGTTATTAASSTSKNYTTNGTYTISVRARDDKLAFSAAVTTNISVSSNTPPTPVISAPLATKLYAVGEVITMTGSATDAQDGTLPASALSWRVILHHDTHTHPFFGPQTGNNVQFTAPPPEDTAAATNSYLEIELTATDNNGAKSVVTRDIQPQKITLSLQSVPSGRTLEINGQKIVTPQNITAWAGWQLPVNARDQNAGASGYRFASWSDAGTRAHAYNTPATNATLTANFTTGAFVPSLDVDNNGSLEAATDGVLLLRYLLGFRDATLIGGGVVGAGAERATAANIATYLNTIIASLDVDGVGGARATTDGVLAMRYLLGITDAALINNARGTGSTRDAAAIKNALDGLAP